VQQEQHRVEFKKINTRLGRIEQILPTVATKDDLKGFATKDDLKGFATKDDLKEFPTKDDLKGFPTQDDPKGFATKDDLKGFPTQDDPKGFATKDDLKGFPTQDDPKGFATTADLKAESQETRRYMKVLYESLKAEIRLLAEGLANMNRALLAHDHLDIRADISSMDLRVLNLETRHKRPRV